MLAKTVGAGVVWLALQMCVCVCVMFRSSGASG